MTLLLILLILYFAGLTAMAYRLGLPLKGSVGSVFIWAVVVGLWPIFLPISIIIELRHRQ